MPKGVYNRAKTKIKKPYTSRLPKVSIENLERDLDTALFEDTKYEDPYFEQTRLSFMVQQLATLHNIVSVAGLGPSGLRGTIETLTKAIQTEIGQFCGVEEAKISTEAVEAKNGAETPAATPVQFLAPAQTASS